MCAMLTERRRVGGGVGVVVVARVFRSRDARAVGFVCVGIVRGRACRLRGCVIRSPRKEKEK